MLNVLDNGEQHNITTTLMVSVQLFCGVANNVSTTTNFFVVCQITGYVFVKAKCFWPFSMCCSIC